MITLLSNVAIQDTKAAANIVYLANIMEGVDGAATFGYSLEPTSAKVEDGQTQQYKHTHTLDIRVLEASAADLTKLKVIEAGSNPVRVSGYSPDGFFVIDDAAQLTMHEQYTELIARRILVTTTGVNGYGGTAPFVKLPVYAGDNLLAVYKVNSGSATYLNGFDPGVAGTVSGDIYTITTATGIVLSEYIFFPFPGQSLTASINVTTAGSGGSLSILPFDSTGAGLTPITASFSGTGIKTVSGVLPANTVYVGLEMINGATTIAFKEPAIRLAGTTFSL